MEINATLKSVGSKMLFIFNKIPLVMRLSILFFFISIGFVMAESSYAQVTEISLSAHNQPIGAVLDAVESQSDFSFIYDSKLVNTTRKVTVEVKNKNIFDILNQLFSGSDVVYTVINNKIILSKARLDNSNTPERQQTRRIGGKVVDLKGEPIIGANVSILNTSNGTITDMDGAFALECPEGATIKISYIGYLTQQIVTSNETSLIIKLVEDSQAIEEVVVIGYGIVKKKDLTGAVSQLSAGTLKDLKVSHPTQAMAGQMAGVQVQQVAGAPGQASTIRVRGSGSISASSSPLYVVDGYPLGEQNLNSINPNDIESIEVLKDASASAIYGSRAANGVVLVTTKSGKSGKVNISLDAYYGTQEVTKKMDLMNAQEFAEFSKEAFNNNYVDRVSGAKATDPLSIRPAGNRYKYPAIYDDTAAMAAIGNGTDWQDEIFRSAPIQNYQLTVTGGDEKSKYMFSGGYFSQDGIIIGSDYERYSARAKIDSDLTKWLKIGINIAPTYMNSNTITQGHWASDGVVNSALATSSIVPVYNSDGTWASQSEYAVAGDGLTGVPNAVASATDIVNKNTNLRLFANMYAEISLLKNLKFKSTIGSDIMEYRSRYFRPSTVPKNGAVAPLPSTDRKATSSSVEVVNWLNENTLSYFASFNKIHEIDAVAGFTVQKNIYNQTYAEGSDFPDDIIQTINNAKVKSGSTDTNEWSLLSYLARVNYRYNNRYYLTASIRADGSSRFGKNTRYGYFPSGSVAWRISQEDFMKDISFISDLKVRASFGLTGNNSIPNYGSIGTMSTQNYVFGSGSGNVVSGAAQSSISNADLTWEKTKQYDLGMELSVLDSRLTFTVDAYMRKTTDLLLQVDVPSITGFTNAWRNIGKLDNKGLEFSIMSRNISGKDFTWNTNFNLSLNRNKVLALGPSGDPIQSDGGAGTTHITMIGEPIGSFYGYKMIGIYMNKADLDNNPHTSNSHVGDVKFEDINKDGTIDANDRTIIGNNMPDFTWGMSNSFTYKNFDLNIMLQGVHGSEVLHLGKRFYTQMEGNQNQMRSVLNRWQSEENPGDGWTPRANSSTTGQNNAVSSRWVEDGSFIRINNLTLGYTLPKILINAWNVQNARFYLSVQNLATFSDYSGFNPETSHREDSVLAPGTDYGMYPLARTYTVGMNVTF